MINTPSLVNHLKEWFGLTSWLYYLIFNVGKSSLLPKVWQALSCVYAPSSLAQEEK